MTSYAVVELNEIRPRGSAHKPVKAVAYRTRREFGQGLQAAITALHTLGHDEPKALILSTHGYRLTGTSFKALDSPVNLWEFGDAFGVLPPNLVVYLSACWGAYPGAIAPIQSGTTPPYVVGPLLDIYPYDANEMENGLLDLLASGPPSRRGLYRLIRRYNEDTEMRREDYGSRRWLFGMQDQEGNFFPRPAIGNQLATRTEEPDEFVVRELVYTETAHGPVACEVEDSQGRRWQADIAALTPQDPDGPTRLIGQRFKAIYQVSMRDDLPDHVYQHTLSGLPMIRLVEIQPA